MATNLGEVIVSFGAETAGFAAAIGQMSGLLSGWQGMAVGAAVAVSAAFIGMGVASVNMATQFERDTLRIKTTAGLTGGSIDQLRKDMIKMSEDTATSTKDMTMPMYNVVSAFHDMHDSEKILEAALKGAKIEQADLYTTTQALTTVMKNYNIPVAQADNMMSSFIDTSAHGRITLEELASSMNKVAPVAAPFRVHFQEIEAALALSSIKSSDFATNATGLKNALMAIEKPSGIALKTMKEFGLGAEDVANTMMKHGLAAALQQVSDVALKKFPNDVTGYNRAVMEMLGVNQKTGASVLYLVSHIGDLKKTTQDITQDYKTAASFTQGWKDVTETLQFQLDKARVFVENLGMKLGLLLIPYIKEFIKWLSPIIDGIIKWSKEGNHMTQIITAIGIAALGFATVLAIVAAAIAIVVVAIIGVAMIIGTIVYAAILLIIHIIQDWGKWMNWIGDQFNQNGITIQRNIARFKSDVSNGFNEAKNAITNAMTTAWNAVTSTWNNIVGAVQGAVSRVVGAVQNMAGQIISVLESIPGRAFSAGASIVSNIASGITSSIGNAVSAASNLANAVASHLPHSPAKVGPLKDIDKSMPAMVSILTSGIYAGIPAINRAMGSLFSPVYAGAGLGMYSAGGGVTATQTIIVQIDKRDFANAIGDQMAKEIRLQIGPGR